MVILSRMVSVRPHTCLENKNTLQRQGRGLVGHIEFAIFELRDRPTVIVIIIFTNVVSTEVHLYVSARVYIFTAGRVDHWRLSSVLSLLCQTFGMLETWKLS